MATKRKPAAEEVSSAGMSTMLMEKIARLLALIAVRDMDTDAAALKLDAIGFDAHDISALLDVGLNYVNVAKHRKKGSKKAQKNR
jgi:hypothetical protein